VAAWLLIPATCAVRCEREIAQNAHPRAVPLRIFRELFQPQHAPYLLQGGFGERALLGAKRCALSVEPHGAFLFRCELLQSRAHKRALNPLEPVGRFAVNHAQLYPYGVQFSVGVRYTLYANAIGAFAYGGA
jgi:hypothetical protein